MFKTLWWEKSKFVRKHKKDSLHLIFKTTCELSYEEHNLKKYYVSIEKERLVQNFTTLWKKGNIELRPWFSRKEPKHLRVGGSHIRFN